MSSEFGDWFKQQLRLRGETQAAFARRGHFSTGAVSDWINGKRVPDPESVDRIADALGADLDVALSKAGHRPGDLDIDPDSPPERLCAKLRRIDWSDPQREAIIDAMLTQMLEFDRQGRQSDTERRRQDPADA